MGVLRRFHPLPNPKRLMGNTGLVASDSGRIPPLTTPVRAGAMQA